MKIVKHAYELVQVTGGTGVRGYTTPVIRVRELYILVVRGARAVYEVNADARIAPVSTTAHAPVINDGAELDGDPTTYAQRKTTSPIAVEDVKTYDFGAIKPLFVCATYSASSNTDANVAGFEIWASSDGTSWTQVFSGNSRSKTTVHFFAKARYLKWVNRNRAADLSSVVATTNLYELEVYDCGSPTVIVSNPDEFDCIIHEAQRKTAADGSKWYILLIEPHEGLAFDYWLYKLKPVKKYYKVTLE